MSGHRVSAGGAVINPLADVAAAWPLSANANDAIGTLHLVAKTGMTSTSFGTGKNGNGWLAGTTSSRFYGRDWSDSGGLGILDVQGNPFSFCCWSRLTSSLLNVNCSPGLVQCGDMVAANPHQCWNMVREYNTTGPAMSLSVWTYNGTTYSQVQLTGLTFNDDLWHFYGCSRSAAGVLRVYFDNQMAEITGSNVPQAVPSRNPSTGAFFGIGANSQKSATSTKGQRGDIDEAYFWTRELTTAEFTQLYNSGNGLFLA